MTPTKRRYDEIVDGTMLLVTFPNNEPRDTIRQFYINGETAVGYPFDVLRQHVIMWFAEPLPAGSVVTMLATY